MSGTVLILGSSGRFGRHAAEAFWNRGWRVRTFDRKSDRLCDAAQGVDVIVNGWNPPYPDWAREVPRLTEEVISAAKATGATVILPGNIYVFGDMAPGLLDERTAHNATNPLGRVRIEMEAAYRASGVQTIVLRAGDFIDTEPSGNWFDAVITAKVQRGAFVVPGDPEADHAWAFLPDLARAAALLAEKRERLGDFEDIPFPGITMSLSALCRFASAAVGHPLEERRFPWLTIRAAGLIWPMGRHLVEMRYLWSKPHRIDGTRFFELLPNFQMTTPEAAVSAGLRAEVKPDKAMAGGAADIAA